MIFQNAKTLLQAIKTRSLKSRKIDIFAKGLTIVQIQKWPFFSLFFLGNIGQENVFYGILQRKIASLGYKNIKLTESKIDIFPWFWSNNGHFSNFFGGGNTGQKNVFYDILERKNAFQGYKNNKNKKSKNCNFSKGVNPSFWYKKWPLFQLFFLRNIRQENVFYDIEERKIAFLGYKNIKFKQSKN